VDQTSSPTLEDQVPAERASEGAGKGEDLARDGEPVETRPTEAAKAPVPAEEVGKPLTERKTFCFVAGTPVHTARGLVRIEDICVGDMVLSQPELGGERAYRRVTDTVSFNDKAVFEIALETADGRQEALLATPNHPFWVQELGWRALELVAVGQRLQRGNGEEAKVVSVREAGQPQRVFNFTVDGFHTYYVGQSGVWVHNTDCNPRVEIPDGSRALDDAERKAGDKVLEDLGVKKSIRKAILDTGLLRADLLVPGSSTVARLLHLLVESATSGKARTLKGMTSSRSGRLGNVATRALTLEVSRQLEEKGLEPDFEVKVEVQRKGGTTEDRYIDLVGTTKEGTMDVNQLYQFVKVKQPAQGARTPLGYIELKDGGFVDDSGTSITVEDRELPAAKLIMRGLRRQGLGNVTINFVNTAQ
jgi:hypothetical protein